MFLKEKRGKKSTSDSRSIKVVSNQSKPIEAKGNKFSRRRRIVVGKTYHQHLLDITDPIYLKPFKHGWKREVAYRTHPRTFGRDGDIYYHPPECNRLADQQTEKQNSSSSLRKQAKSQKYCENCRKHLSGRYALRSFADVANFLEYCHPKSELTIDNFIFSRRPIGLNDPEKEIIRQAKERFPNRIRTTIKKDVSLRESKATSRKQASLTASTTKPSRKKYLKSNSPLSKMRVREFSGAPSTSTTKFLCSIRDLKKNQQPVASTSSDQVSSALIITKKNWRTSKKILPSAEQPIEHLGPQLHQCFSKHELITLHNEFVCPSDEPRRSPPGSPFRGFPDQATTSDPYIAYTNGVSACSSLSASLPSPAPISTKTEVKVEVNTNSALLHNLNPMNSFSLTPSASPSMSPSRYSELGSITIEEPFIASQHQDNSTLEPLSEDLDEIYLKHRILEPEIQIVDEREFSKTDESVIGKTFQFKVLVKKEKSPDELRRFSLQFDGSVPIYPHLCETIRNISSNLRDKMFTLHWKDPDGDDILIESSLELGEALRMMGRHRFIKFDLTVLSSDGCEQQPLGTQP